MNRILKSYFFWTYPRGHVHYDVMVTLILAFIFITPHLWNYGAQPLNPVASAHPIQVVGDGNRGLVISLRADDVIVPPAAGNSEVKKILRHAIESITGDAVFIERWETAKDSDGNLVWKIWAHR